MPLSIDEANDIIKEINDIKETEIPYARGYVYRLSVTRIIKKHIDYKLSTNNSRLALAQDLLQVYNDCPNSGKARAEAMKKIIDQELENE